MKWGLCTSGSEQWASHTFVRRHNSCLPSRWTFSRGTESHDSLSEAAAAAVAEKALENHAVARGSLALRWHRACYYYC